MSSSAARAFANNNESAWQLFGSCISLMDDIVGSEWYTLRREQPNRSEGRTSGDAQGLLEPGRQVRIFHDQYRILSMPTEPKVGAHAPL